MSANVPTNPGLAPVQGVVRPRSHPAGASTAWLERDEAGPVERARAGRRRRRREGLRDLVIAGVLAAGAHGAVLAFNGPRAGTPPPLPVLEEFYEPIEMPVLEPEEMIEVVESGEVTDAPPEMAPPSLLDVPTTVDVATFTQLMQPRLDPSLTSVGALTIPRMTGNFGTAGTAKIQLFDLKDLDRVPRRIRTKVPDYPLQLRRAGITGEVILLVIIDPSGHVEVDRVISATNRDFEVEAVKAAEQCLFESPLRGGQKVSARYTWTIAFGR